LNKAYAARDLPLAWRYSLRFATLLQGEHWSEALEVLGAADFSLSRRLLPAGGRLTVKFDPFYTLGAPLSAEYTVNFFVEDALGKRRTSGDPFRFREIATAERTLDTSGLSPGEYTAVMELRMPDGVLAGSARRPFGIVKDLRRVIDGLGGRIAQAKSGGTNERSPRYVAAVETAEYLHEQLTAASEGYVGSPAALAAPFAGRLKFFPAVASYVTEPFDLTADLSFSNQLLGAAIAGRDPFAGVTGVVRLAYRSAVDQVLLRYFLFIPPQPDKPAPLVVALHGAGGDEGTWFGSFTGRQLPAAAGRRRLFVVSPSGRGPVGGYIDKSERDVFDVIDLTRKLFPAITRQTFLTGHSMGAMATWQLGFKYADRWAGLAPVAGAMNVTDQLLGKAPAMPVILTQGGKDPLTVPKVARDAAATAKALKLFTYREYPEADHFSIGAACLDDVLDFFQKLARP
jgi:pimeloyl-ACP methyl ester carboxylesterase